MTKACKTVAIIMLVLLMGQSIMPLVAETVIVKPGKLQLTLKNTITPQTSSQGDLVEFMVKTPVYQDGVLIVAANAMAFGTIDHLERNGAFGKPAELTISLSTVVAVDGTELPIIANRTIKGDSKVTEAIIITLVLCIFGLFIKGENVTMQAGYTIDAILMGGNSIIVP